MPTQVQMQAVTTLLSCAATPMIGAAPMIGSANLSSEMYATILQSMPIATVDVLIFSSDLHRTLLFNRTSRPARHWLYSIGGRVLHNEPLRDAATRKLRQEIPMIYERITGSDLVLGGVMDEIFEDSAIPRINSHCVNAVFGYVLPSLIKESSLLHHAIGDEQHSQARWCAVDDQGLHPYMQRKVLLLLPLLQSRYTAALLEQLDQREAASRERAPTQQHGPSPRPSLSTEERASARRGKLQNE